MVKLTTGDYSGSHSERYFMTVGPFKHQSPDYGKVGSGVYQYLPGTYQITITHIDSNLNSPDSDYQAQVQNQSGDANVEVQDPQGILGYHDESTCDFTVGKSATLNVTGKEGKPDDCSHIKDVNHAIKRRNVNGRENPNRVSLVFPFLQLYFQEEHVHALNVYLGTKMKRRIPIGLRS